MPRCSPGSLVWVQCVCYGKVFTASGEWHVVLLDLLCGYSVFAMVRSLLHANSRSHITVICVSNLTAVPAQSSYASLPIFAFQSPMIMVISFFRVLAIVSSSVS